MKGAVFLLSYLLLSDVASGMEIRQSLIIQLTFHERTLQVAELIKLTPVSTDEGEELEVEFTLPLVAPVAGGYPLDAIYTISKLKPLFESRLSPSSGSVEIKGDSVVFKGRLKKGTTQRIEFTSSIPYVSEKMTLGLMSTHDINSLKVIARFTERISPLVRPYAQYTFAQEIEENAVYQFFTLSEPLKKGELLKVHISQIPRQFDFLKRAALGVLTVITVVFLVLLLRKKNG